MREIIQGFQYPIYAVDNVGRNNVVVAGGGGSVKTGVPNRIDLLHLDKSKATLSCSGKFEHIPKTTMAGGVDTDTEAVMNLTVSNSGDGSFITSLEGRTCVEYLVIRKQKPHETTGAAGHIQGDHTKSQSSETDVRRRRKSRNSNSTAPSDHANESRDESAQPVDQWEFQRLRSFTLPLVPKPNASQQDIMAQRSDGTGLPTCVTSGGAGGCWLAVGSDLGSVFLIDRYGGGSDVHPETSDGFSQMKPSIYYPDVSLGQTASVCSLSLTCGLTDRPSLNRTASNTSVAPSPRQPLMATVCDQPGWGVVRVWRTDLPHPRNSKDCLVSSQRPNNVPASTAQCRRRRNGRQGGWNKEPTGARGLHMDASSSDTSCDASLVDEDYDFGEEEPCTTCRVRLQPYAMASCNASSSSSSSSSSRDGQKPLPTLRNNRTSDQASYRFKHCQFLPAVYRRPPQTPRQAPSSKTSTQGVAISYMLVTSVQPLCANRKSVSRVVIWLVPDAPEKSMEVDAAAAARTTTTTDTTDVLELEHLTEFTLPQGHLPACLAVHPSRCRSLIAVGTMEGRVDVLFLSPSERKLQSVYSLDNAHPIFVTSLAFLPPQPLEGATVEETKTTPSPPHTSPSTETSFDLVSASVDRALCWHRGPDSARIGRLARGLYDAQSASRWERLGLPLLAAFFWFIVICLFPIYVALLDVALTWFT